MSSGRRWLIHCSRVVTRRPSNMTSGSGSPVCEASSETCGNRSPGAEGGCVCGSSDRHLEASATTVIARIHVRSRRRRQGFWQRMGSELSGVDLARE